MKAGLFISEVLFVSMAAISLVLAYLFFISKNGKLRKLLIIYFLCQWWVTTWSGTYFFLTEKNIIRLMDWDSARIVALLPITCSMIALVAYLIRQNRKKKDGQA